MHSIEVRLEDNLTNSVVVARDVDVALAPPDAPAITNVTVVSVSQTPATNHYAGSHIILNTKPQKVTISGIAPIHTGVVLKRNGASETLEATVTNQQFLAEVPLEEGLNRFTAAATNRRGLGRISSAVTITLDTSPPGLSPKGLSASALDAGIVDLSWRKPFFGQEQGFSIKGYNVYRSTMSLSEASDLSGLKINNQLLTETNFEDMPVVEGNYYYAVTLVDLTGKESSLSDEVMAVSDHTLPSATRITFVPRDSSTYDPRPRG